MKLSKGNYEGYRIFSDGKTTHFTDLFVLYANTILTFKEIKRNRSKDLSDFLYSAATDSAANANTCPTNAKPNTRRTSFSKDAGSSLMPSNIVPRINISRRASIAVAGSSKKDKKRLKSKEVIEAEIRDLQRELASLGVQSTPCNVKTVRDLKILTQIGSGSSCKVYSCCVDGWICAMKEVDIQKKDLSHPRQISQEIDVLEKLPKHRNLMRYLFFQRTDEKFQIFTQLYSGSLDQEIAKRKQKNLPFSRTEIVCILSDIASGLRTLHAHKIIHRGMFLVF